MAQINTAISIHESLFRDTDAIAQEMHVSRSQVVALALEEFVHHYLNKKILEQIKEAYAETLTPDEKEILDKMRLHQERLLDNDRWC